ncbi:hypothetical protein CONPUDRAFT_167333 [Coniophora puteana RWD-64-598 SS2]|uniref:MYND-type domain-containing protein n=1 Tax=Coniophora puteana (strain RWD-64-598) TaxID=741705 RepID=A0A5M3MGW0_CONPW|nr:uncharacterized protein CONPUDRAFT_167333 [Coniophora puteana RWD-64-598 SS2]EIW78297.1 hypothetical protein CONPUDRAFT_167333 [Coniophora puteana RWD-64-598 SS2]
MEGKICANCGKEGKVMQCSQCGITFYCSSECQRDHWKTHKPNCHPFAGENVVTLKPTYMGAGMHASTISPTTLQQRTVANTKDASRKGIFIKIQAPAAPATAPLYVYNKKRDLQCFIHRDSNEAGYDEVVETIRAHGVMGMKAYFSAFLKNKNALVVKVSEVLEPQPF